MNFRGKIVVVIYKELRKISSLKIFKVQRIWINIILLKRIKKLNKRVKKMKMKKIYNNNRLMVNSSLVLGIKIYKKYSNSLIYLTNSLTSRLIGVIISVYRINRMYISNKINFLNPEIKKMVKMIEYYFLFYFKYIQYIIIL